MHTKNLNELFSEFTVNKKRQQSIWGGYMVNCSPMAHQCNVFCYDREYNLKSGSQWFASCQSLAEIVCPDSFHDFWCTGWCQECNNESPEE